MYNSGDFATGTCAACTAGKYCPGGDGQNTDLGPESECPSGLESKFAGAKSQAQCFTKAGNGRKSVRGANGVISYEGVACPVGTYNVGGNTAGCQKCGAGLTTASDASSSPSACRESQASQQLLAAALACVPARRQLLLLLWLAGSSEPTWFLS